MDNQGTDKAARRFDAFWFTAGAHMHCRVAYAAAGWLVASSEMQDRAQHQLIQDQCMLVGCPPCTMCTFEWSALHGLEDCMFLLC